MSTLYSMLEQLQNVAQAALAADSLFNGTGSANGVSVPIVIERKNDIGTQIETALGSVGICALVTTPTFELFQEQDQDLSGWAELTVDVLENVTANQSQSGTQIRAIKLAVEVLAVLHWYKTGLPTGPAGKPAAFIGWPKQIQLGSISPILTYTVNFRAHVLLP
jgi:hypothetical protein